MRASHVCLWNACYLCSPADFIKHNEKRLVCDGFVQIKQYGWLLTQHSHTNKASLSVVLFRIRLFSGILSVSSCLVFTIDFSLPYRFAVTHRLSEPMHC